MQHIVPEAEWEAFMACLRTTLPITFRINGSGKFADALRRRLETDFLAGLVREGQQVLASADTDVTSMAEVDAGRAAG